MGFQVNKMLCQKHSKRVIGNCKWCGKSLCKNCDFKNVGRIMYCTDCIDKVSKMPKFKEKFAGMKKDI